ncbi:MAG: ATP-binding protein [Melioribacteraceae bacterium]|nr:ATP-binding protein [Melioribacteraceae bacterium]
MSLIKYQRPTIKTLEKRLSEKRKYIQLLAGPRQVGKTTLISQYIKTAKAPTYYVSADNQSSEGSMWISKHWETVRLKLKTSKRKVYILIIDEIQKIPEWSEVVKKNWDEDTRNNVNIKVVLLGSSQLLIQEGLSESLAGRFEYIHLGHWTYNEIHSAFKLTPEEFAWYGGYPGSMDLINNEQRWKDYINYSIIDATISKDILLLTQITKPILLKNLFELGSIYSSQILSYNKILGQFTDAGNTTTLAHYLKLLDASNLLAGISKFTNKPHKKRSSSPKFQVYNTALISAQMNTSFQEIISDSNSWGRIVESVVGAHLLNNRLDNGYAVFYWRDGNDEVDFILKKDSEVIALEVKSGIIKNRSGLNKFNNLFSPNKVYVIDNSGLSWQEFITINPKELFN